MVDPHLDFSDWAPHEQQQLAAAVAELGTRSWAAVAQRLTPRTDSQCRRWGRRGSGGEGVGVSAGWRGEGVGGEGDRGPVWDMIMEGLTCGEAQAMP